MCEFIDIIDYDQSFPEGHIIKLNCKNIDKFYSIDEYKYISYIIDSFDTHNKKSYEDKEKKKKYKKLIKNNKIYIKDNKIILKIEHSVMIETKNDNGYTGYYFSDLNIEEFEKKCQEKGFFIPENKFTRFEIMDI